MSGTAPESRSIKLQRALRTLLVTAWVGTTWAIGYLAAPVLFATLDDRMLAGQIAGRMFSATAWLSLACGALVLLLLLVARDLTASARRTALILTLVMLACTAAGHFGIQPMMQALKHAAGPGGVMDSELRGRFGMLHGVSSCLFLLQSLAGAWLVLRLQPRAGQS